MSDATQNRSPGQARSFRGWISEMPRWKKISLLLAGAVLVTGAVLMVADPGGAAQGAPQGTPAPGGALQSTLSPNQPGGGSTSQPAGEPTAKGVFRLGFSFIAGFALGSFLRATMRIASIALGFWLAMTLVLSYYGLVEVNWQGLDQLWSKFMTNIESEWSSFQSFVTGSLPAAALVVTGFAVGVKRH